MHSPQRINLKLRLLLAVGCAGVAILEAPGAIGALAQALPGTPAVAGFESATPLEISVAGLDR